ncbi:MAG: tRNA (adenosine(37)-N6)-dimethylallyltransferase MiaA [Chitinophagaceae bacterium]|nr:tRNA (adenosine(37)-N6)-dimethylallyltransferase MiaA [Chitinophagaceae bacterium]
MNDKTCIVIAGPTAVGKTALAIDIARHFNTSVISADSRQCFKELNIGVAKPSAEQLKEVRHYFINSHTVRDTVNAAVFEEYAINAVEQIFQDRDTAVMAGGTGLYIKAFCEGLNSIPSIDRSIRSSIVHDYTEKGLSWLQQEVSVIDPLFFSKGEIQNPQRLMRALEVMLGTGSSLLSFYGPPKSRGFKIVKIGIELPREQLYDNINNRVNEMIRQGLVEEVRSLLPFRNCNALQTVGYKETFAYLDGRLTEAEAVNELKTNTRHYAKRQLTWFKKDPFFQWFHPSSYKEIIASIIS